LRQVVQICHTRRKCAGGFVRLRQTVIIKAPTETYDFRFGDVVRIVKVKVPKSEAEVSTDQRDEAERLDDLAHALADLFGRKVVVVWPDDKEAMVEPRPALRLDG
jgi:hypothetical protein